MINFAVRNNQFSLGGRLQNAPTKTRLLKYNVMHKAFILLSAVFLCALAGCQERFEERLQREAREFTAKHCPQEREPGTVLDSTTYSPSRRTYSLWYTVSEPTATLLQTTDKVLIKRAFLNELTNSTDYKLLKDEGIDFEYHYARADNRQTVYHLILKKEDYRRTN